MKTNGIERRKEKERKICIETVDKNAASLYNTDRKKEVNPMG